MAETRIESLDISMWERKLVRLKRLYDLQKESRGFSEFFYTFPEFCLIFYQIPQSLSSQWQSTGELKDGVYIETEAPPSKDS